MEWTQWLLFDSDNLNSQNSSVHTCFPTTVFAS